MATIFLARCRRHCQWTRQFCLCVDAVDCAVLRRFIRFGPNRTTIKTIHFFLSFFFFFLFFFFYLFVCVCFVLGFLELLNAGALWVETFIDGGGRANGGEIRKPSAPKEDGREIETIGENPVKSWRGRCYVQIKRCYWFLRWGLLCVAFSSKTKVRKRKIKK